jgi:hypothetical protein
MKNPDNSSTFITKDGEVKHKPPPDQGLLFLDEDLNAAQSSYLISRGSVLIYRWWKRGLKIFLCILFAFYFPAAFVVALMTYFAFGVVGVLAMSICALYVD